MKAEIKTNKGIINLELFKDKNIVIYFYPKDMTPGCTLEAKEFSAARSWTLRL